MFSILSPHTGSRVGLLVLVLAGCAHEGTTAPPASPGSCATSRATAPPAVDPQLAPPAGVRLVAHASACGTQNYECAASPDAEGGFAWTLRGPEAMLGADDGAWFGRHYARDGAPAWLAADGSFVVGKKVASAPSSNAGAVPWLLLQVTATGGNGKLNAAAYVQRTGTSGGGAPASGCDAGSAGAVRKVPYSADYWFFGR